MSGRSTTGSKTACVPTSSSACSPIISNGTCASAWPPCSTTTPTRRPPRRSARARSQKLSDRPPPSPSRPQAEPTMVSPSTASTPCFTTSPPSPKTPSRPPSRPTSPSQSPHGRHTSRKKHSTSWASPVPSNTPIQLDLIKLEQWVAQVERGKLRLAALESGPDAPGSVSRDEILPSLRSLHVARHRRGGRHFMMYRAATGQVIEVVRILHDAMDLARHIPPETFALVPSAPLKAIFEDDHAPMAAFQRRFDAVRHCPGSLQTVSLS